MKKNGFLLAVILQFYSYAPALAQTIRQTVFSKSSAIYKLDFYSQTYYDSRFDGSTNESRARYFYDAYKLKPYVGLNYSRDLSYGNAPILTLNAWSPGLGILYKPIQNIGIVAETRRLFTDQIDVIYENRFGIYLYHFGLINNLLFHEIYSEAFSINYVDSKPYWMISSKFGFRSNLYDLLNLDFYYEAYSKISPNLGYGPTENEIRIGSKLSYYSQGISFALGANVAPLSDVKRNGADFMFVLSGEF